MKSKLIWVLGIVFAGMLAVVRGAPAQENWDTHCAKCHGKEGKGDTRMGEKLGVKDYTDPAVQAQFTDDAAIKAIKEGMTANGKKTMPGYADKLSDEEIQALVKHIRAMKKSG